MKNQNRINSILRVLVIMLSGVIMGIGVYGCKKEQPASKAPASTHSVKPEPSTESVSSDDNLYSQSHKTVFEGEETTTAGAEPIIVDTQVVWRIAEPQQFLSSDYTLEQIENRVHSRARDTLNRVIGRHHLSEFFRFKDEQELLRYVVNEDGIISSESSVSKFSLIQDEMLAMLRQGVSDAGWGIEIEQVLINQIRFSEDVRENVRRMLENRR